MRDPCKSKAPQPTLLASIMFMYVQEEVGRAQQMKLWCRECKNWCHKGVVGVTLTCCKRANVLWPHHKNRKEWLTQPANYLHPCYVVGCAICWNGRSTEMEGYIPWGVRVTPKKSKRFYVKWHLSQFNLHPSRCNSANIMHKSAWWVDWEGERRRISTM